MTYSCWSALVRIGRPEQLPDARLDAPLRNFLIAMSRFKRVISLRAAAAPLQLRMLHDPRLRHRERMRRYRQRQAAGDLVVTRRFTPAETAKLHRLGYLRECELEDRAAICEAVTALIADVVEM
jgi:hypothetical protein